MFRIIQCCKELSFTSSKLFSNFQYSTPFKNTITPLLKIIKNSQVHSQFHRSFASVHDVNTKVTKDIILYKYDNPRFFKIINIFAISQFIFWNYLSYMSTGLRDAPPSTKPDDSWYRKLPNLGENKYRNGITILCFLIGYGILTVAWTYTLRSVRYLVLLKGGETVSIVTYTPFGKNRIIDVPLKCISAEASRDAKSTLPLKVKNKSLYYVLDMKGEFKNTKLYDYTVGLKRKL